MTDVITMADRYAMATNKGGRPASNWGWGITKRGKNSWRWKVKDDDGVAQPGGTAKTLDQAREQQAAAQAFIKANGYAKWRFNKDASKPASTPGMCWRASIGKYAVKVKWNGDWIYAGLAETPVAAEELREAKYAELEEQLDLDIANAKAKATVGRPLKERKAALGPYIYHQVGKEKIRFMVFIPENGKRKYVGTYDTIMEAQTAQRVAASKVPAPEPCISYI
jgi:hypothetical protein